MDILKLTKKVQSNYFDYQKLSQVLKSSHTRRDISRLLKNGHIIRVKKGLYIWGDQLRDRPYSKEILSNLIYGPSYVSLEYALSFHGLIPERVEVVTSVTMQRNKSFQTPVGNFNYRHTHLNAYPWGIQRKVNEVGEAFLMACEEKALLDYIALYIKKWNDDVDFEEFLFEDLRMDEDDFEKLDHKKIEMLARYYKNKAVKKFAAWVSDRGERNG